MFERASGGKLGTRPIDTASVPPPAPPNRQRPLGFQPSGEYYELATQELLKTVRDAGVVGAGGAGFPTYKKLDASVSHIIANGAECEPLLQKDRESMQREPQAFFAGLDAMRQLTGATRATVALKRKNADLVDQLGPLAKQGGYEFFVYEDVYPAGDEYVLVYEITGKQIPPGGLPLHVDCVVDNVETIINIGKALQGTPVVDKYVTITGAVASPLTMTVPIGTSFADCLRAAGGCTVDDPTLLVSGVMMGGVSRDMQASVTKTTAGLIALPPDHYLVRRKTAPRETYTRVGHGQCDQCSFCTELCPRYILGYPIEPHRVMRTLLMTGEAKERGSLWAQYCCECNICSLVACPEQLDPKNICVDAKALLRENKLSRTPEELKQLFRPVHPARHGRELPIKKLYQRLGLTPYDRKAPFVERDWEPREVKIPLNMHIGQPARPVVSVGASVSRGDVIANVEGDNLGCPIHASISGQVKSVSPTHIEITNSK
jgi:Na+-translocating ferredoxin:NAD+ oxidoreductase RnfC subunit